jgi:glutaredoxin
MAIKLYRCANLWAKLGAHPCWRVQKALNDQGIEYEVVKGPLPRGKRDELEQLSGQRQYPVIQFEDGSVYRADSKEMEQAIRGGKVFEHEGAGGASTQPAPTA